MLKPDLKQITNNMSQEEKPKITKKDKILMRSTAILEFIKDNVNSEGAYHNDLYSRVKLQGKLSVNRSTIFRALNSFVSTGVLTPQEDRKGYFVVTV